MIQRINLRQRSAPTPDQLGRERALLSDRWIGIEPLILEPELLPDGA